MWLSGKESVCQCRRRGLVPWVGKIPWRRKWQPTPVFLPGKSRERGVWQATVYRVAIVGHDLATTRQQIKATDNRDFPRSPVVKTPQLHCGEERRGVPPLVRKLRAHMLHGMAKKNIKKLQTTDLFLTLASCWGGEGEAS